MPFTYTTNNGAITITGYTGTNGAVIIPATINGYPVTSIADEAFVESLCTSVTIPNSVNYIGSQVFWACPNLTNLVIGSGVTNLGSVIIEECSILTNITVDASNPSYSSLNGVLFDKAQANLIVFSGDSRGSYTIPNSVTSIASEAFYYCYNLNSVTIPNSVTNIGSGAFAQCYDLTNIVIGSGVTGIGNNAFNNCMALARVYFQGNAPIPSNDTSVFQADSGAVAYYLSGTTGWGSTLMVFRPHLCLQILHKISEPCMVLSKIMTGQCRLLG